MPTVTTWDLVYLLGILGFALGMAGLAGVLVQILVANERKGE